MPSYLARIAAWLPLACMFVALGTTYSGAVGVSADSNVNSNDVSEIKEMLQQTLAELSALRASQHSQRAEIASLRDRLSRTNAAQLAAQQEQVDKVEAMHARHLSAVEGLGNHSGVFVKRDDAMVAMGVEGDVKLVRGGFGKLVLLADEVHIQGRLFLNRTEITAECCAETGPIYTTGVLFNFSDCSGDGWNNTESPFEVTSSTDTWVQKISKNIDADFEDDVSRMMGMSDDDCQFNSYIGGETATGVAASDPFYVTKDSLSFWSVGFTSGSCTDRLGEGEDSYVAVVNAEDESEVWATTSALGGEGSTNADGDYVRVYSTQADYPCGAVDQNIGPVGHSLSAPVNVANLQTVPCGW